MTTILFVLLGIWILKAFIEVFLGVGQIILGLVSGAVAAILYALAFVIEGSCKLFKLAFGKE